MGIVIFILIALAGALAIALAYILKAKKRELAADILRDIGIALVVAFVVSIVFEVHERNRQDLRTMQGVLDAAMGQYVPPEVWLDVRNLISKRTVMRRNVQVRIKLVRERGLKPGEAMMWLQFEYELFGLQTTLVSTAVQHELDYQFQNERKNLPRFERLVIEKPGEQAQVFEGDALHAIVKDGAIRYPVSLAGRDARPVRIRTDRWEITHAPGSYNLYMQEITKGLRIQVDECPPNVAIDVRVRPQERTDTLKPAANTWVYDDLILPGQGVEIKFIEKK